MPERLRDYDELTWLGTVIAAHGLRGELKVAPLTDDPEYYLDLDGVFLEKQETLHYHEVESFVWRHNHWLLAVHGVDDRTTAESYKRARLLIPDDALKPLAEGEFFQYQLYGCEVFNVEGQRLGVLKGILETGANDVYEVQTDAGEFLVPAIPDIVKQVDVTARRVVIDPIPGLLGEEDA